MAVSLSFHANGFRLSASGEIPHNVHTVPGIPVPLPGTVPSLSHPDIPDRTGWILPCGQRYSENGLLESNASDTWTGAAPSASSDDPESRNIPVFFPRYVPLHIVPFCSPSFPLTLYTLYPLHVQIAIHQYQQSLQNRPKTVLNFSLKSAWKISTSNKAGKQIFPIINNTLHLSGCG